MQRQAPKIVLDVHAHLAPVMQAELAGFDGVNWDASARRMTVDGYAIGMTSLFDPQALLDWMEHNAVEHVWVSAPPPLYRQQLRGDHTRSWIAYLNEGLARIATESNGRLSALMHLPTEEPAIAASVVAQWISRGHRLFSMPCGTGDERTLGDEAFEPLWSELDTAGAFVFFHPGECADGRLSSFYLTNLLGNPYETTVAIAHLVMSGVLERHPGLIPCFAHGGGMTPAVAGRWERGYVTKRPGVILERDRPSKLLSRILVDCICHGEAAAESAEQTFGEDNMVFGSDWPFPMGLVDPHQQLAATAAGRRHRYFIDNPRRLRERFACQPEESK